MIYFDAGATTLQKPERVRRAMYRAAAAMSSPGRGSYPATRLAEETDFRCRSLAAALFDVEDPACVVFTSSATHGLNIAIKTLVKPGCRVVISGYEHNAVTRPLHGIPNVELTVIDAPLFRPESMLAEFEQALDAGADAVICTHVSNVFGYRLPAEGIAALCRRRDVPFVLDASQSAGMLPVSMRELGAAFIAMPGHKGLYGPQGTGLLLCGHEAQPLLEGGTGSQSLLQHMPQEPGLLLCGRTPDTLLEGGSGSASRLPDMPQELPDRLEAGTHNMPGIAGLLEGLRFVAEKGVDRIAGHERRLAMRAEEQLRGIDGVELFCEKGFDHQTGVLSFRAAGRDCEELGERLAAQGAAVRAGLHCAPLAHRTAGTLETGTVRVSMSVFNTPQEVDRFTAMVRAAVR